MRPQVVEHCVKDTKEEHCPESKHPFEYNLSNLTHNSVRKDMLCIVICALVDCSVCAVIDAWQNTNIKLKTTRY